MGFSERITQFNQTGFLPEGWFWLAPSVEIKTAKARPVTFWGQEFAIYRGEDGIVRLVGAYCPHMGAHLGDGLVDGKNLRCLFHNWKFSSDGTCIEIPCQKSTAAVPALRTYKVGEKYGLVWIWTGQAIDSETIPEIPELAGTEVDWSLGNAFVKECHPNVVMINAIDAQHFNTVHNLVVDLNMEPRRLSSHAIQFANTTRIPKKSLLTRFLAKFYAGALRYQMTYWYGHTGSVTLGPDFLHFHIIFALRPSLDGKTEGQTILLTKKRAGLLGSITNRILLFLTAIVGNYFAKGDTIIFSRIKFAFRAPIAADHAIIEFIRHYEAQKPASFLNPPQVVRVPKITSEPTATL